MRKPYKSTTGSVLFGLAVLALLAGVVGLFVGPWARAGGVIAVAGFLLVQVVNYRFAERDRRD